MSFHTSVLYPNPDDVTFDMDYYLGTHMPLVDRLWKPEGLLKWEIVEFATGADGKKPPYRVAAHLTFKDEASYSAAFSGASVKEILGDIPNFYNKEAIVTYGKIVGGG